MKAFIASLFVTLSLNAFAQEGYCDYFEDHTLNELLLRAQSTMETSEDSIYYEGDQCGDSERHLESHFKETVISPQQMPSRDGGMYNRGMKKTARTLQNSTAANIEWAKEKNKRCAKIKEELQNSVNHIRQVSQQGNFCAEQVAVVETALQQVESVIENLQTAENNRNDYISNNERYLDQAIDLLSEMSPLSPPPLPSDADYSVQSSL